MSEVDPATGGDLAADGDLADPAIGTGPLIGIRILDLSSVVMGPYATQTLGDMGAEIISVEDRAGDINRSMGKGPAPSISGVALNLMRNKRSIVLDLKKPAGRQAFLDLAAGCDAVITNLRPGPLGRLGLTYDAVREVRPDVVFCQAHGFPSDGPMADAPAYDDIIQSAAGIPDLFERQGFEPILLPTLVADKVVGMAIANAVTAGLFHRLRTGEGQFIEVPMVDVIRSFVLVEHGSSAIPEPKLDEPGHRRILTPHRRPQPTADGLVHVMPYSRDHYRKIFTAAGRPELDDDRLATRAERYANSDSLYRDLAIATKAKTTAEWLAFCEVEGIPCTAVATLDELIDELPIGTHPQFGDHRVIPHPVRFQQTPASIRRPAPALGEHGRELLAEAGYDKTKLDALEDDGSLGAPSG